MPGDVRRVASAPVGSGCALHSCACPSAWYRRLDPASEKTIMKPAVSPSALRVQAALGDGHQVLEFDRSVRTAAEAAATIGCTVAQIAKSIVFRAMNSGRSVLVIAS